MSTNKLLVICGPTATGKTALGIKLAQKYTGEILSADSRQVYKGMDLGTGKDAGEYTKNKIPVWGLNLVEPDYPFNVADYVRYAQKAIANIHKRGKPVFLVGGTGLYIKGTLHPPETIYIPPDSAFRKEVEEYSIPKLQTILRKFNLSKWKSMNDSDRINPRRLIRAIEVARFSKNNTKADRPNLPKFDYLKIGLTAPRKTIYERIDQRLEKLVKSGMEREVCRLLKNGISPSCQSMSGTGYQVFARKLADSPRGLSPDGVKDALRLWQFADHAYARRQLTWFTKDKEIHWFNIAKRDWQKKVVQLVDNWYN